MNYNKKNPCADCSLLEIDCLFESNAIENEHSMVALDDAMTAWCYARDHKDEFSLPYVLEIHRLLMQRLEPGIAGKVRDCDVWIGGRCKIFISVALLEEQIREWCNDLLAATEKARELKDEEKEELAKTFHIFFENIHFAIDGNGRCGRILYQVHRLLLGLPIKVIESSTKYELYYPWFR